MTSIASEHLDEPDKVEVYADLLASSQSRSFLEQIVSRMSLENTVSAISWRVMEAETI